MLEKVRRWKRWQRNSGWSTSPVLVPVFAVLYNTLVVTFFRLRTFLIVLCRISAHDGGCLGVCFSPNGKLIASCGEDKLVKIWSPQTGLMRGVYQASFSLYILYLDFRFYVVIRLFKCLECKGERVLSVLRGKMKKNAKCRVPLKGSTA
jgi:WD40 repeat protein